MVNLTIDNRQISVPEGTTILEAAEQNRIYYPQIMLLKRFKRNRRLPCMCCGTCRKRTAYSFLQQCSGRRNGDLHKQSESPHEP